MSLKKLPLGIQNFRGLIEGDYVYAVKNGTILPLRQNRTAIITY